MLGVGRIGSAYGYHLARAGHHVTAIARPGSTRLAQLTADRAIVLQSGERAAVTPADRLDEQAAYDVVIVCLMDYQVDAVLPSLHRSKAKAVQLMFNTYRPERLVEAVGGAERCSLGFPLASATIDADGRLHCNTNHGRSLLGDRRWVDMFNTAGLPATYEPRMALWLRNHASFGIAFEAVCVLAKRAGKGGASWADAMMVARGMHQGLWLTQQLGYPLYGRRKGTFYYSPTAVPAAVLWALTRMTETRGQLAEGEAECRAMCDAMIAQAAAAQPPIPVPALQAIRRAIQ